MTTVLRKEAHVEAPLASTLATIQAEQDGILRVNSKSMPIISAYGSDVSWALRDAISYR